MGTRGFPDIAGFYAMLYGTAGVDLQGLTLIQFGNASGLVFPGNPPYYLTDFLGSYPKFFGCQSSYTGLTITANSQTISGFTAQGMEGLIPGQLVVNLNSIPKDSIITAVDTGSKTITINNRASASDTTLSIYKGPFIPIVVMLTYVFLARSSLMCQRYAEMWPFVMGLFIAHYCTLWLRAESGPNATAAQVASSGLEKGLIAAKSAGGVSAGIRFVNDGYEQWGAFQETTYGIQFITIARAVNCGPIYVI